MYRAHMDQEMGGGMSELQGGGGGGVFNNMNFFVVFFKVKSLMSTIPLSRISLYPLPLLI